jgi:hypothetical protein
MKQKIWFFDKISKIIKTLAKLTKRRETQINKTKDEKGDRH